MGKWTGLGLLPVGALLALGCGGDGGGGLPDATVDGAMDAGGDADAEPTCTVSLWDPDTGDMNNWPAMSLLTEDPTTGTGYRLAFDAVRLAEVIERASGFAPVFTEDLSDLDGFGNNAQLYFRFGRAFDPSLVPSGDATSRPGAGLGVVVLEETGPRAQPVIVELTDEDATLMLAPMAPLPERTWAVGYVTRDLTAAGRGCLEPSPDLAALVAGSDPRVSQAISALADLGIIDTADDLVALTVFPVQTITEDSVAIAADIAGRDFALEGTPECFDEPLWIRCEGRFTAFDYRGEDGVIRRAPGDPITPGRSYVLPVTAWLPKEGEGPFPTLVWGSGLGSGRRQGDALARFSAPRGIATVAIDPFTHGEHPAVPEGESREQLQTVIRFFTIGDTRTRAIRPLELREHWRQATYDKLQLTRLLEAGADFTGNGAVDLDPERIGYLGVSLGGIMGVELLALSDTYGAGVLVVPGGRVSAMVSDSALIGTVVDLLRPRGVTDGDVRRFFPVLQTLLERGDAASYGPHVLEDRLQGSGGSPSLLLGVVLDDDTVPNVANYTLVRSLRIPTIPPLLRPEPGLFLGPDVPVAGNLADGQHTAGMLQFDVIREDDGEVVKATHSNVGDSEQGVAAWLGFLEPHFLDGQAVILDPYALTGLAHEECAGCASSP